MKSYTTAFAFRRALEDRLNAASKAEGVDLQRMRRQVTFGCLLVRLFHEGSPPWRLKGGYALELKLSIARTTRDLDLGLSSDVLPGEELLEALQAAAARDAGDFFMYAIGEPTMDLDGAPYGGSRHPVEANLDGRLFARFHLKVELQVAEEDDVARGVAGEERVQQLEHFERIRAGGAAAIHGIDEALGGGPGMEAAFEGGADGSDFRFGACLLGTDYGEPEVAGAEVGDELVLYGIRELWVHSWWLATKISPWTNEAPGCADCCC